MKQDSTNQENIERAAPKPTQLAAIAAFILINLIVPLSIGELFPFTASPRFSDEPEVYCRYKVYSLADHQALLFDSKYHFGSDFITPEGFRDFGLQRVYNGNPTGLGVGVIPPRTVNQIGEIATEADVRRIVEANLLRLKMKSGVLVQQVVVGAIDDDQIGELELNEWEVSVPAIFANDQIQIPPVSEPKREADSEKDDPSEK